MTKVKTIKMGIEEKNAYCQACDWSSHDMKANIHARSHAAKENHNVDIYVETRSLVRPIKE